jgi:hypothetical protein
MGISKQFVYEILSFRVIINSLKALSEFCVGIGTTWKSAISFIPFFWKKL